MKVPGNRIGVLGLIIILLSIPSFVGNPASAAVEMKFSGQARVRGSLNPIEELDIVLDAHYFRTAAEYEDFAGLVTQDLGTEFNLTMNSSCIKGSILTDGVALFLSSESFAGIADPDPSIWGFTTLTVNF